MIFIARLKGEQKKLGGMEVSWRKMKATIIETYPKTNINEMMCFTLRNINRCLVLVHRH